jgi:hypothetical protein
LFIKYVDRKKEEEAGFENETVPSKKFQFSCLLDHEKIKN